MPKQLSYESYSTSKDFDAPPPTGTRRFYQSFLPTVPFTISSAGIYVGVKTTNDYVYYNLYLADADGKPTGDALLTVSDIWCSATGWAFGDVDMASPPTLYPGTSYCLMMYWGQGKLSLGFDTGYTDGKAWLYDGSTWVDQSGDFAFQLWGTAAAPAKATSPIPLDNATDVTLDQATIGWSDGGGATSYNVYYGVNEAGLTLVSDGQIETSFTVSDITNGSPFDYAVTRYWRIDSINSAGTTTGDTWSFTTITYDPPKPTGATTWNVDHWDGTLTGENTIATIKKLVIASDDMIWYENV
jgi:hypothetical protein